MNKISENNKRIAKNTIILYFRMLLIMAVTLYTSRVVLNVLGVEDYGIYNAVGGFVAMFAVISNSLTAAISRFITYELGTGHKDRLQKIFSVSLMVQMCISLIVLIFAETVGLWFLNTHMTIPVERLTVANWVYQLSIWTFVVNLIGIPYYAEIVAHERISAFAYIGIVQALATLVVAFLIKISPFDALIFYAILTMLIAFCVRLLYSTYCSRHFEECKFSWAWDTQLIKQILGFSGWNFIGASSGVLRDQGVNVLLNVFCGPAINAARGIAMQVSVAVTSFSNNFMIALNPQITKSYAAGNLDYMLKLVFQGARLSFYMLLFFSLPLIIEAPLILKTWLSCVPDHTVLFVRLILIYVCIESLSSTMITVMLATGKIRNYQILVGSCQLMNFPVAYIVLKLGYSPESTVFVAITIALLCLMLRLFMLHRMVAFPIGRFTHSVLFNVAAVGLLSSIVPLFIYSKMYEGYIRFFLTLVSCVFSVLTSVYFVGCTSDERHFVKEKIIQFIRRVHL